MKKISLLILTLFSAIPFVAQSQNLRLNLYTAYAFDDQFDSYYDANNYYEGKIKGGFQWGTGLEYTINNSGAIEILYLRQTTTAPTTYLKGGGYNNIQYTDFDLGLNYILLAGGGNTRKPGSKLEGYGRLMAGMLIADIKNPDEQYSNNTTKFAWGLKGGANIWITESIAIKMQLQLLSAVQSMGGGFYFGTGGSGAALSAYSSFYQFSLGGGLVFNFPTGKK